MQIVIRADASSQIGTGHIMRCLTLADALREQQAQIVFLCSTLSGDLISYIQQKNYLVHPLTDLQPATTVAILQQIPNIDWLIVDHYGLERSWEMQMRPYVKKILVIDDLADRHHDCDVLLDQNFYTNATTRYQDLVPSHCKLLLGGQFALLRPEFVQYRQKARLRDGNIRKILVFFGGSDPTNETAKTLVAIQLLNQPQLQVDVVVGNSDSDKQQVQAMCQQLPNVNYHCQINNMAELMADADLAIAAGGSATWERCCVGLPTLTIAVATNQLETSLALARQGKIIFLGNSEQVTPEMIKSAILTLLSAREWLNFLTEEVQKLVDGLGVHRVVQQLVTTTTHPAAITLRLATMTDCENVYHWRNDAETRRYAFNVEPIDFAMHQRWFVHTLGNPQRVLLIGEIDEQSIGVLRYDMAAAQTLVSVYLVPQQRGQGYAAELLKCGNQWLRDNRQEIKQVHAEIREQNHASAHIFRKAGFTSYFTTFIATL
jgi:UDP-2,4-diacetamido-2,4,6-trideoxy-beta-L-altropyranose hydrolase